MTSCFHCLFFVSLLVLALARCCLLFLAALFAASSLVLFDLLHFSKTFATVWNFIWSDEHNIASRVELLCTHTLSRRRMAAANKEPYFVLTIFTRLNWRTQRHGDQKVRASLRSRALALAASIFCRSSLCSRSALVRAHVCCIRTRTIVQMCVFRFAEASASASETQMQFLFRLLQ